MTTPSDPYNLNALEANLAAATTPSERVSALAQLSFALGALGQADQGLTLALQACTLGREVGDEAALWRAVYYAAVNCVRLARNSEALPLMREALDLAERCGNLTRQAISLDGIASIHCQFGDLHTALTTYERCLELHRAAGRPDNEVATLGNLARVYDDLKDFVRARQMREQVVTIARQQNNVLSLAGSLNNLGYSSLVLGEFEQATEQINEALSLARDAGGRHVETYCLSNLAKVQDGLQRHDLALQMRLQALEQSREVGDRGLEAELLTKLGTTHRQLHAYDRANDALTQALALHEALGEKKGLMEALLGLSQVAEVTGDLRAALEFLKRHHATERIVLGEEAERSGRLLAARFETEAALRDAELYRLEKVELAQAYEALRVVDEERRELLAQLEHQAHHDALTGLGNRRAFDEELDRTVSLAQRHGHSFGVQMIDLDGLKAVNDKEGHGRGDGLLREFADALRKVFRKEDRLFRLGGDEYAVILDHAGTSSGHAILERVRETVQLTRQSGYPAMDASSGVAFFPVDGVDGAALTRLADDRMYAEKRTHHVQRAS